MKNYQEIKSKELSKDIVVKLLNFFLMGGDLSDSYDWFTSRRKRIVAIKHFILKIVELEQEALEILCLRVCYLLVN